MPVSCWPWKQIRSTTVRFPRLLAGLGLAALTGIAGTACTTHAGAAAQVGSSAIETSTLRDIVERGVEAVEASAGEQAVLNVNRPMLQRNALTTLVRIELLESEADRLGVSVSDQEVDAYYQAYAVLQAGSVEEFEQQAAGGGYDKEYLSTVVYMFALQSAIVDKVAPDKLASEDEAREYYDTIVDQFGEIPLSFEQSRPYLQRLIPAEDRAAVLLPLLEEAAQREGISINPRFGQWNMEELAVVSADGTIATTPEPAPGIDLPREF